MLKKSEDPERVSDDDGARHKALMQAFGAIITRRRAARGLSQEQLGMRMRPTLRKQSISLLERGITSTTIAHLIEIARALDCAPQSLIRDLRRNRAESD